MSFLGLYDKHRHITKVRGGIISTHLPNRVNTLVGRADDGPQTRYAIRSSARSFGECMGTKIDRIMQEEPLRGNAACKHHDDVSEVEEAAEPTKFWAVRSLPNTALAQHLKGTVKEGLQ